MKNEAVKSAPAPEPGKCAKNQPKKKPHHKPVKSSYPEGRRFSDSGIGFPEYW